MDDCQSWCYVELQGRQINVHRYWWLEIGIDPSACINAVRPRKICTCIVHVVAAGGMRLKYPLQYMLINAFKSSNIRLNLQCWNRSSCTGLNPAGGCLGVVETNLGNAAKMSTCAGSGIFQGTIHTYVFCIYLEPRGEVFKSMLSPPALGPREDIWILNLGRSRNSTLECSMPRWDGPVTFGRYCLQFRAHK